MSVDSRQPSRCRRLFVSSASMLTFSSSYNISLTALLALSALPSAWCTSCPSLGKLGSGWIFLQSDGSLFPHSRFLRAQGPGPSLRAQFATSYSELLSLVILLHTKASQSVSYFRSCSNGSKLCHRLGCIQHYALGSRHGASASSRSYVKRLCRASMGHVVS